MESGFGRQGLYVHTWPIHFVVRQKLTEHCKAAVLQFKTSVKYSSDE